ncbi:MAG: hypothetical protein DCF15_15605 [Phormidesmis priestleyi]|uniref:DUF4258 domain-containing protein n=1 Tax=Phormidesmis priestleyi TaxID=268141 RepID=A0A2W4X8B9_9CYAN|nr:MAG: hypothetical protein DCF15_15605 [Phormidesmis priestleyi]
MWPHFRGWRKLSDTNGTLFHGASLRGHSCLILGSGQDNRPIHVVCALKDECLAIITPYIPDPVH